jgi:hypothetical protein
MPLGAARRKGQRILRCAFIVVVLAVLAGCGAPQSASALDASADRDKLTGRWRVQNNDPAQTYAAEWTIDMDAGTLTYPVQSDTRTIPIAFERVDGRTVYVNILEPELRRTNSFRFVSDIVLWDDGSDNDTTVLERIK